MCWNCGCMSPDDDHGNPDNITTETLRKAGRAGGPGTIHKLMGNLDEIYHEKIEGTPVDNEAIKRPRDPSLVLSHRSTCLNYYKKEENEKKFLKDNYTAGNLAGGQCYRSAGMYVNPGIGTDTGTDADTNADPHTL